jgi:hypothetical protein
VSIRVFRRSQGPVSYKNGLHLSNYIYLITSI